MRFTTRVAVVQVVIVIAAVLVCSVAFTLLGIQRLRAEAESAALAIARTVATDGEVRTAVDAQSADPGTPDAATLADGALQTYAQSIVDRTGALFVVITDDHGIRLSHPDPARLGEEVSTSFAEPLAGRELVEWDTGTLGESARAKVPVFAPGTASPVGEVSVGFARTSVFAQLPAVVAVAAGAVAVAIGATAVAVFFLRRRWERMTLGLQPEELVSLVRQQTAVLDGIAEGVLAVDDDGIVRLCNDAASGMLGLDDTAVGRPLSGLGLPAEVEDAIRSGVPRDNVIHGERVLFLDSRAVARGRRSLGRVVVVRDRTSLVAVAERLESVRALGDALRAQQHEFANRLHVAAGLLDADRIIDARAFLDELLSRGAVDADVPGVERLTDPFLTAFVAALATSARERGVSLAVGEDTLVLGRVSGAEDIGAVLGNLVDNAITAAAAEERPANVTVTLLADDDALVLTVADSGGGMTAGSDPFTRSVPASTDPAQAHGHGFGLRFSRDVARRRGGEVWIIDPGGAGSGAVVGARLPAVLVREGSNV